jgi:hypothetical protein
LLRKLNFFSNIEETKKLEEDNIIQIKNSIDKLKNKIINIEKEKKEIKDELIKIKRKIKKSKNI